MSSLISTVNIEQYWSSLCSKREDRKCTPFFPFCVCVCVCSTSDNECINETLWKTCQTYNKAELLVVAGVHGLAFLDAATVVGLALHVKGNSPQLKDDVPLSLHMQRRILNSCPEINLYFLSSPFYNLRMLQSHLRCLRSCRAQGSLANSHVFPLFLLLGQTKVTGFFFRNMARLGPNCPQAVE